MKNKSRRAFAFSVLCVGLAALADLGGFEEVKLFFGGAAAGLLIMSAGLHGAGDLWKNEEEKQ